MTAQSKVNNYSDCLRRSFLDYVVKYSPAFPDLYARAARVLTQQGGSEHQVGIFDNHFYFPISRRQFVRVADASSFRHLNIVLAVILYARPEVLFARYARLDKPHHRFAMSINEIATLQKQELEAVSAVVSKGTFKVIWAANNNAMDLEINLNDIIQYLNIKEHYCYYP